MGVLCKNPSISVSDRYNLQKEDFTPNKMHRIIFATIQKLYCNGVNNITEIDIGEFIRNYPEQAEILEDGRFMEFIPTVRQLCEEENLDNYINIVKKYSLLRSLQDSGFDIGCIIDVDGSEEKQSRQLEEYTLDEIIKTYEIKMSEIKKDFYTNTSIEEYKLGDDLYDIVKSFKKAPLYGYSTMSGYLNTATRGLIQGQLQIYSIPSGGGKSCIACGAMAKVCCDEVYDLKQNKWIPNESYSGKSGLIIDYEMEAQTELSPRILASIAQVPAKNILDGTCTKEEDKRVEHAIEVANRCGIYIVTMPSYTIEDIKTYVKDYVLTKNVGLFVFDYISSQSSISSEIAKKQGTSMRDDQILATISSELKNIARENDIAVLTFTQTNGNIDLTGDNTLGAEVISGSRAVMNKADCCAVINPLRTKERELYSKYHRHSGFGEELFPNRVIHLSKLRFGGLETNSKIFGYLDLSTGRWTDMLVLNGRNEPIKVDAKVLAVPHEEET